MIYLKGSMFLFNNLNMSGRDFRTTTKLNIASRADSEFVTSREINCKVARISDDMQK